MKKSHPGPLTAGLLLAAITLTTLIVRAASNQAGPDPSSEPSEPSRPAKASQKPAPFVAHEWGTFTSVQGADAVQFEWNPFNVWDLPDFVYGPECPDASKLNLRTARLLGARKALQATRQRMETPVIYFYSDSAMNVDVEVDFPQGTITEWFPQASAFGPASAKTAMLDGSQGSQRSFLRWNQVAIGDSNTREADLAAMPQATSDNHYFAARATDANVLRVTGKGPKGPVTEHESFLFYRGVGQFEAPLRVGLDPAEKKLLLHNQGSTPLTHLFAVEIRQGKGRFASLGNLNTAESKEVSRPTQAMIPLDKLRPAIAQSIAEALVTAGLYVREAEAMVATWRDSWFGEDGLRVLYLLPQDWTDAVLPLQLDPAPTELVRVMVGRAELLTPSMEWELLRHVARFVDAADDKQKAMEVDAVRAMGLGRFAEPLAKRVLGQHPNMQLRQATYALLQAAALPTSGARPETSSATSPATSSATSPGTSSETSSGTSSTPASLRSDKGQSTQRVDKGAAVGRAFLKF